MWKLKKSTGRKPPQKSWSKEELKIIGWGMTRNIKISMTPDWKNDVSNWLIDISINNKIHTDPKRYSDEEVHENIIKYYKYYYDKYNK